MTQPQRALGLGLSLLLAACSAGGAGEDSGARPDLVDREPGERAPRTAACDAMDPLRCYLPWPSSAFLEADASSATGVRLAIDTSELPVEDDASYYEHMDGFSRITPFATGFDGELATDWLPRGESEWLDLPDRGDLGTDGPVFLINNEPDHPEYGQAVPVWVEIIRGGAELNERHLLVGRPRALLAPNCEYVVVVTRELTWADGSAVPVEREVSVALGLDAPASAEEDMLAAYHAPVRTLLGDVGIDASEVLRVWDFTTRTSENTTQRVLSMMDQAQASLDDVTVEIDYAATSVSPEIDAIVVGRVVGVPDFIGEDKRFTLDAAGDPQVEGTREAHFRVVIPARGFDGELGTPYRVALYGHGTGGDYTDTSFDEAIASNGLAKLNLRFHGWNGAELVPTLAGLTTLLKGTESSTAQLSQGVADGYALLRAMEGPLAEALAAETLGDIENPAAGRPVDTTDPVWVGGSLGGTMGAIIGSAYPEIDAAVLNVPAAGWTHLVADSLLYDSALGGIMEAQYDDLMDVHLAIVMSQTGWDDVDGAVWADHANESGAVFLLQESIGDPVVPNQGTEILAIALGAPLVGPPLEPIVGVDEVDSVTEGHGMTQYKVPDGSVYDIHGFAARSTLAGDAAMEQIFGFIRSYWDGEAQITFPEGCSEVTPAGDCDFSEMWTED